MIYRFIATALGNLKDLYLRSNFKRFSVDPGIHKERAELAAARTRVRVGGRKPRLSEDAQRKARIAASYYEERIPVNQIAKDLDIYKATLYKYLRFRRVEIGKYEKQKS